jgi:hypothetical protein
MDPRRGPPGSDHSGQGVTMARNTGIVVTLALLAALLVLGQAAGAVEGFCEQLPDSTLKFQVTYDDSNPHQSLFKAYVDGTGTPLDTGAYESGGAIPYPGWCLNPEDGIDIISPTGGTYAADICSSIDVDCIEAHNKYPGCSDYLVEWRGVPKLNYILNTYHVGDESTCNGGTTYTFGDIQYAMWYFVFGQNIPSNAYPLGSYSDCRVGEIVHATEFYYLENSFTPHCGDIFAIVFFPRDEGTCAQAVIGVLDFPCPGTEVCDGFDNDCDGIIDGMTEDTTCGEGFCTGNMGTKTCIAGAWYDTCDPFGGASDEICDGVDNDCDGITDEDYPISETTCGIGACASTGQWECQAGVEVNTCTPGDPALDDKTCDGVDDDCDGSTDENYVPTPTTCGIGACAAEGQMICVGGKLQDTCDEGDPALDDKICDGVDNDCDGSTDEDYLETPTSCGIGACKAAGQMICVGGEEKDTCVPGNPTGPDMNCNGLDDDCDGTADDGYIPTPTTCGVGICASTGEMICVDGKLVDTCKTGSDAFDGCDGIDNNCDGVIDEDCGCTGTAGYWLGHPCVVDPIFETCEYELNVNGGVQGINGPVNSVEESTIVLDKGACALCVKQSGSKITYSENPLNQLYRQSLAAELAINNCVDDRAADPTNIQTTITEVKVFLAETDCLEGCSLGGAAKQKVSAWNTILDRFNQGLISPFGPPECPTFPCR